MYTVNIYLDRKKREKERQTYGDRKMETEGEQRVTEKGKRKLQTKRERERERVFLREISVIARGGA